MGVIVSNLGPIFHFRKTAAFGRGRRYHPRKVKGFAPCIDVPHTPSSLQLPSTTSDYPATPPVATSNAITEANAEHVCIGLCPRLSSPGQPQGWLE